MLAVMSTSFKVYTNACYTEDNTRTADVGYSSLTVKRARLV